MGGFTVSGITPKMLHDRQTLPLEAKIARSQRVIRDWYQHWDGAVYVSLSGGKDSTVLLDIIRSTPGVYDVPAVFCDTGLEYPEVRANALNLADVVLKPRMTFKQVIEKYGYPCVSKEQAQFIYEARTTKSEKLRNLRLNGRADGHGKVSDKWKYLIYAPFDISHQCCHVMKKSPMDRYAHDKGRNPMTGMMAIESSRRTQTYLNSGCNAFDSTHPKSMPLGFWTEQDVLEYIVTREIQIPSVYGEVVGREGRRHLTGVSRTGCMFCMFGVHLESEPNRFQRMQKTHPKQYEYCMEDLGLREVLRYMHVPSERNPTLFDKEVAL